MPGLLLKINWEQVNPNLNHVLFYYSFSPSIRLTLKTHLPNTENEFSTIPHSQKIYSAFTQALLPHFFHRATIRSGLKSLGKEGKNELLEYVPDWILST